MMSKTLNRTPIASCDAEGNVRYTAEYLREALADWMKMPESPKQYQELLVLASNSLALQEESLAKDVYEFVLRKLAFRCDREPAYRVFAEQALAGLSTLSTSSNEYIWETSSQIYSDYRAILEQKH